MSAEVGKLEEEAEACGILNAIDGLRSKAKLSFLGAGDDNNNDTDDVSVSFI